MYRATPETYTWFLQARNTSVTRHAELRYKGRIGRRARVLMRFV